MARARNLKPGFFRDAALVELPIEARLLFPGLWTLADRAGRLDDKPKQIKMEIYPADSFDVDALLTQLADAGLIIRYEIDGQRFIQVKNFEKHQNPHRDEKPSTIPAPLEHGASTVQAPCEHDGNRASTSNLQPISLIEPLSDKSDAAPVSNPEDKKSKPSTDAAKSIIDFLNLRTGRKYRHTKANLDPILARMREGYTEQEIRTVTMRKVNDWLTDEKMNEFLRPATLYTARNFNSYAGILT